MFNPAPVYQRNCINGVLERHVYKQRLRSGRDGPQPGDGILSQRNIGYDDVVIVGYVLFQQLADRIGDVYKRQHEYLPEPVTLIRGEVRNPYSMVGGIDESYDAVLFVGYHDGAGQGGNPMAHTISSRRIREITINGASASELMLFSYACTYLGIPTAFVSGDEAICEKAKMLNPLIAACPVKRGIGAAVAGLHPEKAEKMLEAVSYTHLDVYKRQIVMYGGQIMETGTVEDIFYSPLHPYTIGLLQSIPKAGGSRERLSSIAGTPPDMLKPPTGCPFYPRCEFAMHICREREVPDIPAGGDHMVRCWLCHSQAPAVEKYEMQKGGVKRGQSASD